MRVQHKVLEGSLQHPAQLVNEGAVVGDGTGFGKRSTVLILNDALQLGTRVAGVAAVPELPDQALLHALPGVPELLEVQIWPHTWEMYCLLEY